MNEHVHTLVFEERERERVVFQLHLSRAVFVYVLPFILYCGCWML